MAGRWRTCALCQELVDDERRNRRICEEVIDCMCGGRTSLVLAERKDHLDRLEQQLAPHVRHLIVLRAGLGRKQRQSVAERLVAIPHDEPRVLLATGRFVGEGFDDPRLDTLFLTLPVSWRGTIAQYAGRLHRLREGKREVRIYDYAVEVPNQHLADPVAYRRDRRKDLLLQENGYLVLRFLAQDVGKDLEHVLDTILRALAHQRSRSRTGSSGAVDTSGEGGVGCPDR